MYRKLEFGMALAILSGIFYGLSSIAFKYKIDSIDYQSIIQNSGFLIAIGIFIISWISLFIHFRYQSLLKIAFLISIIYIIIFVILEISFSGLLYFVIAFILIFFALSYIKTSVAWPLTACKFVVSTLLAYLLLGEKLNFQISMGIVFVILGSIILVLTNIKSSQ